MEVKRQVAGCGVPGDEERLAKLLMQGWEPFAVTSNGGGCGYVYHLRLAT